MGNDAISNTKKPDSRPSKTSVNASPIIIIIAIISVVGLVLFLFKDKIFKKKIQNLDELKQKEDPVSEPTETETLEEPEAEKINEKFSDLSNNE